MAFRAKTPDERCGGCSSVQRDVLYFRRDAVSRRKRTNFMVIGEEAGRRFPGGEQPPEEVVDSALAALDRGRNLVVPRLVNKFAVVSQKFAPRTFVAGLIAKMSR